MDLAKPGKIKDHCDVNAVSTFMEYLCDYASDETLAIGEQCIATALKNMNPERRATAQTLVDQVKAGKRDCYV